MIAPIAPMPADPMVCRWCGVRRVRLPRGYLYCPTGCAPNHLPIHRVACQECDREFDTGRHLREAQCCYACDQQEIAALARSVEPRRYEVSRFGRGGVRD